MSISTDPTRVNKEKSLWGGYINGRFYELRDNGNSIALVDYGRLTYEIPEYMIPLIVALTDDNKTIECSECDYEINIKDFVCRSCLHEEWADD